MWNITKYSFGEIVNENQLVDESQLIDSRQRYAK